MPVQIAGVENLPENNIKISDIKSEESRNEIVKKNNNLPTQKVESENSSSEKCCKGKNFSLSLLVLTFCQGLILLILYCLFDPSRSILRAVDAYSSDEEIYYKDPDKKEKIQYEKKDLVVKISIGIIVVTSVYELIMTFKSLSKGDNWSSKIKITLGIINLIFNHATVFVYYMLIIVCNSTYTSYVYLYSGLQMINYFLFFGVISLIELECSKKNKCGKIWSIILFIILFILTHCLGLIKENKYSGFIILAIDILPLIWIFVLYKVFSEESEEPILFNGMLISITQIVPFVLALFCFCTGNGSGSGKKQDEKEKEGNLVKAELGVIAAGTILLPGIGGVLAGAAFEAIHS